MNKLINLHIVINRQLHVQMYWLRSDIFIVNFEHISHHILVFLLLTLSR